MRVKRTLLDCFPSGILNISKTKKVQTINLALAWSGSVHLQFNNRISQAPFSLAATSSHGWNIFHKMHSWLHGGCEGGLTTLLILSSLYTRFRFWSTKFPFLFGKIVGIDNSLFICMKISFIIERAYT